MSDEYVTRVAAEAGQPGDNHLSGHGQRLDGTASSSANKTRGARYAGRILARQRLGGSCDGAIGMRVVRIMSGS
jgi:hypothetical protein